MSRPTPPNFGPTLAREPSPHRASTAIPLDLTRVVLLAAAAAVSRVALAVASEGFAAKGLVSLCVSLASARFLQGFLLALAVFLSLRVVACRLRARAVAFSFATGLVYLFLALRLPSSPLEAPGWSGGRALVGQAVAILCAVGFALALVHPVARLVRRERPAWVVALVLVAAALAVRIENRLTRRASAAAPNVILISLDSLRADRVGCAGSTRGVTPNLDAFAQRALRFENAFTPAPSTLMAHASLLTGEPASGHGASATTSIDPVVSAMAEWLKVRGYDTIAQVGDTPWLDEKFGFTRGFDAWRVVPGGAAPSIDALEALLPGLEERRFFLFLHFDDAAPDPRRFAFEADPQDVLVHAPPNEGDFHGCDRAGRCGARYLLGQNEPDAVPASEADVALLSGLYDAGVRSLDRRLGRLFDDLAARGLLENSIVIVTADHGQSFREHGRFLHFDAWGESTHVPLIVRPPGGVRERSVADVISTRAIVPWLDESTWGKVNTDPRTRIGLVLAGQPVPEIAVESDAGRFGWAARTSRVSKIVAADASTWTLYERRPDSGDAERAPLPAGARSPTVPDVLEAASPPVDPRRGPTVRSFDAAELRTLEWSGEPLYSPGQ